MRRRFTQADVFTTVPLLGNPVAVAPGSGLSFGVVARYTDADPARDARDAEVRGFFDGGSAWFEDPVTGSLNAGVAQWLIGSGRLSGSSLAGQGQCLQRGGRVHVEQDGDRIWVGGDVVTVVHGEVTLDGS